MRDWRSMAGVALIGVVTFVALLWGATILLVIFFMLVYGW